MTVMSFFARKVRILVVLAGVPGLILASVECSGNMGCNIGDTGGAEDAMYGWVRDDQVDAAGFDPLYSTDMVLTVVTVINTVLDTTTTHTEYPTDYTTPPTNSDGTRIEEITYTRNGQVTTTVLTYPSFFAVWPDDYTWDGEIQLTDANGDPTSCLSAPSDGFTVTIVETPQPTDAASVSMLFSAMGIASIQTALDPQGLSYHLASDMGAQWALNYLSDLFPGSPEVTHCPVESPGPNWGQFTSTNWTTTTTTQYTDGGFVESTTPSATEEPVTSTTVNEPTFSETEEASTSSRPTTTIVSQSASSSEETSPSQQMFSSDVLSTSILTTWSSEEISTAGAKTTGGPVTTSSSTFQSTGSTQTAVTASAAAVSQQVGWTLLLWAFFVVWQGL